MNKPAICFSVFQHILRLITNVYAAMSTHRKLVFFIFLLRKCFYLMISTSQVDFPVDGSVGQLSQQISSPPEMSSFLCFLISFSYNCRCHPASSSRCPVLGRNSRCSTGSFPLWSLTSLTSSLKVLLNRNTGNTRGLIWFNTNGHSEYNMQCVFQVPSSACCVGNWHRRSAPTVLKILFSAIRDSKSSARRAQLRCR